MFNKKSHPSAVTASLDKDSVAHAIDVNGKDTKIILAVKSNIFCYSLIENRFISAYEGHANQISNIKFNEYTVEQKKNIDAVSTDYFLSLATGEQF